tara:strand:- start:1684 stop:2226 length:543 start_codon:yes stop_codon:yes gene_type:complete
MTTLTTNQQDLINQLISEFIQHNEVSERTKTKSLLGVDEIIDSLKRKKEEIARIKEHNKAVFKAIEPIFDENYEALSQDINALGLNLHSNHGWGEVQDGRRGLTMKISMFSDRRSDYDFYLDGRITGDYPIWEGQSLYPVCALQPILLYTFRNNNYTFEQLCKNPDFIGTIKRMYEIKTK